MSKFGATIEVTVEAESEEAAIALMEKTLETIDKIDGVTNSDLNEGPNELFVADDEDED